MNSEELEQSLKAEFENHLKRLNEGARQQIAEFQSRIQSDLERHRAEIDDAFRGFADRFEGHSGIDGGFAGLVAEHLKLARDEGAKLAAEAYAEAEKISVPDESSKGFAELRDAINDISSKESQAAILGALVERAAEFAPRGAFFIVKNDHFAGWKAFGDDHASQKISEVHFPVSMNSILGHASETRSAVEASYGSHAEDGAFLDMLNFGQPDKMYAIPLVARGRGVAVLYVDHGTGAGAFNLEAVETLVRIAGMTVELMAVAAAAPQPAAAEEYHAPAEEPAPVAESNGYHAQAPQEDHVPQSSDNGYAYSSPEPPQQEVSYPADNGSYQPAQEEQTSFGYSEPAPVEAAPEYSTPVQNGYQQEEQAAEPAAAPEYQESPSYEAQPSYEPEPQSPAFAAPEPEPEPQVSQSPFERTVTPFEPAAPIGSGGVATLEQAPTVEVATPPATRARLSDRQVDLPIDVPEEERRLHNDARRFARLLVSEIKLYNEKRVMEGRQAHDLYDRLKEAIDRSREMYDKRVQPPVAARFDYFHFELVNSLAEGDAAKFGNGYPGASV